MASIYRVRSVHTGVAGTPYYTNTYFRTGPGIPQDVAGAMSAFWFNTAAMRDNNITTTVEPEVQTLNDATGEIIQVNSTVTTPVVGTNTGDELPRATQGLARFRTGIFAAGRQVQGRMYLPAPCVNHNAIGRPTPNYRETYQSSLNTLVATPEADLVVYSPARGASFIVTASDVWSEWSVLRSRRD